MPSKLEQMQLQFRQRLKEERMIKIHTDNQQKALDKVSRYNGIFGPQSMVTVPKPTPPVVTAQPHHSPIKKGSPGVDRSRPLPPISKETSSSSSSRSSPTDDCSVSSKLSSMSNSSGMGTIRISNGFTALRTSTTDGTAASRPQIVSNSNGAQTTRSASTLSNPRSRSVEMEQRLPSSRVVPNSRMPPQRNGYARNGQPPRSPEPKSVCQPGTYVEKRQDQDALARMKQAELQRMKSNMKAREDNSLRNGTTSTFSRSSTEQKKAAKPTISTSSRPKPRTQVTAAPSRGPVANSRNPAKSSQPASNGATARKPPGPGQEQCSICGRNFNQDRIEKHRTICKKAAQKKVKVFDATKMRTKGTEAESFVRKGLPKNEPKQDKKSDWRKKHNDFIETIRQAKMVQQHLAKGGKISDLPPPPPSDTSDYVPCPHCGRKFSEAVADRHIPKCKNILSNKKNANTATTSRRR